MAEGKDDTKTFLLLSLLLWTIHLPTWLGAQEISGHSKVLVLSSYHHAQVWSEAEISGIDSVFYPDSTVNYALLFLDSKRNPFGAFEKQYWLDFLLDYQGGEWDLVIALDNNAFWFLMDYRDRLFVGTPLVFAGVNDFSQKPGYNWDQVYGVKEKASHWETISLALKYHPYATEIVAIVDSSATGISIGQELLALKDLVPREVTFNIWDQLSMEELQRKMAKLDSNTIVYFTVFNQDSLGRRFDYSESFSLLEPVVPPVYTSWDFYQDNDVIGGKIVSGFEQGRRAAILAKELLSDQVPNLPFLESPNVFRFHHEQLQEWHIPQSILPEDVVVIGAPLDLSEILRDYAISGVLGLVILLSIIGFLIFLILSKNQLRDSLVENQKALSTSNAFLTSILDSSLLLVFLTFDKSGKIGFINESGAELLGLSSKDMLISEIFPEINDAELVGAKIEERGIYQGEGIPKQRPEKTFQFEMFNIATPEEEPSILMVALDISEKHQYETRIIEEKRILDEVLNHAPIFIYAIKSNGEILFANNVFCQFYGLDPSLIRGRNHYLLHESLDSNEALRFRKDNDWVIKHQKRLEQYQETFTSNDSKVHFFQSSKVPLRYQGEEVCLGVSMDITTLKAVQKEVLDLNLQLEARVEERTQELSKSLGQLKETQKRLIESEKMASMGNLVAGVAHEINTPIGIGVTGLTALLEETKEIAWHFDQGKVTRKEFQSFLEKSEVMTESVLINLKKASSLIGTFKQVAVTQTQEDNLEVNLSDLVMELEKSLGPRFEETGIQFNSEVPEDLTVSTSPDALAQIMTNLIVNSIVHGFDSRGPGRIDLLIRRVPGNISLLLKDNGKGMEQRVQERVFEPFFTTKKGQGGTGLGMQIVYNLVTHKLGGQISLTSSPGAGTTFVIKIPQD